MVMTLKRNRGRRGRFLARAFGLGRIPAEVIVDGQSRRTWLHELPTEGSILDVGLPVVVLAAREELGGYVVVADPIPERRGLPVREKTMIGA